MSYYGKYDKIHLGLVASQKFWLMRYVYKQKSLEATNP